jgi:hypothetical protein
MCGKATNPKDAVEEAISGHSKARYVLAFLWVNRSAIMSNDVHTRVTVRTGFAEHFGCLSPLSLSNGTLGSEVAASTLGSTRHDNLSIMAAGPMGSREKERQASKPCLRTKRDSGGLRGERADEKALCTGIAMRHEVCLSKSKRIIRIVYGRVSGRQRRI